MLPVDRESPMPLWSQVETDLRSRIEAGEFVSRFPTDEELVETYGVSRHTAREAVRRLCADGLVVRERGRGTTLTDPGAERPLDAMYSLFEAVEAGGVEQTSELLSEAEVTDPEAALALGIGESEALVFIERLRRAAGEPLALDRVWLPAEVGRPLLGADWSHTSLYSHLAASGTGRPDAGWERARAVLASAEDTGHLSLEPPAAVFCLERLGRVGERCVEWRRSLVRADRFAVVSHFEGGRTEATLRLSTYAPHSG